MNGGMMLEFLMENDVILKSPDTKRMMTADEMYVLGGEFIVYLDGNIPNDLYRGVNFEVALGMLMDENFGEVEEMGEDDEE